MLKNIGYYSIMAVLLIIEFPFVLIVYFVLSIIYCLYTILEFIFKPFKNLFEKLFG